VQSNAPKQQKTASDQARAIGWRDQVIARFWTLMANAYGQQWVSNYGESTAMSGGLAKTPLLWMETFASKGYSPGDVFQAVQRHLEREEVERRGFPPNLDQLLGWLKKPIRAPYHQEFAALPAPIKADPHLVANELAKIREIMRG
jgi:hypothetical protein